MTKRSYQVELKGKKIAKAMTKNANVSLKFSLELIREIKGKRVDKAEIQNNWPLHTLAVFVSA